MSITGKRMELKIIVLREISQTQTNVTFGIQTERKKHRV